MARKLVLLTVTLCVAILCVSCEDMGGGRAGLAAGGQIRFIVLDPGHYHAALVQKTMYEQVSPLVCIYAPDGPEVQEYLKRIGDFNSRPTSPTDWQERAYVGSDYLSRMTSEKMGDVVVLSGNNRLKTVYIKSAVDAGLNVFSEKPMCIDAAGFRMLEDAFASAEQSGVLLYDMMTERFNIFRILQKMLVLDESVFGELKKGSIQEPAVIQQSVHHLFKYVSGMPIKRPKWYFDTKQQGEGLVDVTTHLVDLAMWTCFPEQAIDHRKDVVVRAARRQPTMITRGQYEKVTGADDFPDYLKDRLDGDGVLPYYCNGQMVYSIKGIHVGLSVEWAFQAPEGAGDTQRSVFAGTRATVLLEQGAEQGYKPQLYVEPAVGVSMEALGLALENAIVRAQGRYPGLSLKKVSNRWQVVAPDALQVGHEAHFKALTERYLQYVFDGKMPAWEVANMLTKYYITTRALRLANQ